MKKAFTLVELLVVIGILGILAGVLMGTFSGAGDSARATKCLSNMRNLGMAVQSYAMSSGGSFPSAEKWISVSSQGGDEYISPYDSNAEAREFSLTNGQLWASVNRSRDCYVCPHHVKYARNNKLGTDPLWSYVMSPGLSGKEYGSVDRADRMLLFAELPYMKVKNGEFQQTGDISGDALDPVLEYKGCEDGGDEVIGFNHKVGKSLYAHICYADGHVEKLLAPRKGDAKDLTAWLCKPTDNDGNDFDLTFDGEAYQQNTATE